MNIKLNISGIAPLFPQHVPIAQVYSQLRNKAKSANLLLAEPQTGVGYLQWTLPGDGWTAYTKGDEAEREAVAEAYNQRKATLQAAMDDRTAAALFTLPSNDYIFFRAAADGYDIGIAAWGYRFPNQSPGGELGSTLQKQKLQSF